MTAAAFHTGEHVLQREVGSYERLAEVGPRVIRDHMPEQHREFFPLLPWLLVGSVDDSGQPWASVLAGPPGFVQAPDARTLRIDALPGAGDPLAAALRPGAPLGILGLQPHTRRRNRMNGRVAAVDGAGLRVVVDQSFGNCPKYIQPREPLYAPAAQPASVPHWLDAPDGDALALVRGSDTFFIATAHPRATAGGAAAHGVDVSHRGGPAGFVRVSPDGRQLAVPDYLGNGFFNTLGNLQLEPRCGLLFIDWARGDLLQVAARAELVRDPERVRALPGAQRVLLLTLGQARWHRGALPLRWV